MIKNEVISAKQFREKYGRGQLALPSSLSRLAISQHKHFTMKKKKPEQNLQKQLCNFIRKKYPNIYFLSDASGLPIKSWGLRMLLKKTRSTHAALDIVILYPRAPFHALAIELKRESPYLRDGSLKSDQHLQDQQKTIDLLRSINIFARFIWNFEDGKELIEAYLLF